MDDEIDKNLLMKALENEENEKMLSLTSHKIMAQKNDILQKLRFGKDQLKT